MAGSVNKVILVGNLGADPDMKAGPDGRKFCNLRIATTKRWTTKDGEKKDRTDWHAVSIFAEPLAKVAEAYLRKGSRVYLEGALRTRKYTDKAGSERYVTEVVLQGFNAQLVLLDGKQDAGQADDGQSYAQAKTGAAKPYTPKQAVQDDIPF